MDIVVQNALGFRLSIPYILLQRMIGEVRLASVVSLPLVIEMMTSPNDRVYLQNGLNIWTIDGDIVLEPGTIIHFDTPQEIISEEETDDENQEEEQFEEDAPKGKFIRLYLGSEDAPTWRRCYAKHYADHENGYVITYVTNDEDRFTAGGVMVLNRDSVLSFTAVYEQDGETMIQGPFLRLRAAAKAVENAIGYE